MIEYYDNLYCGSRDEFFGFITTRAEKGEKTFVVTANPETFMHGSRNPEFDKLLRDEKTVITADGIGVVKAAKWANKEPNGRVTGVETVSELLRFGSEKGLSVYFYGAKPEVLEKLKEQIDKNYPGLKIVGMRDGYNNKDEEVFADMKAKAPDLCFVALGIPRQEILIYKNLPDFQRGIFIGIGGSLDVLSGTKKRAPKLFIKLNCEWLYRIMCEPKRIGRFYNNNVKFFKCIKKEAKKRNEKN
ncbi:MAG: WecB/TagA/CpsF family glycosyltransferase [Clostridia bacterium]|nr:WecB/TagA/CpsF family glycosyltransferase [Clostridia bacterium]